MAYRLRTRLISGLTVLLICLPLTLAFAWNGKGHMMVAFVAYQRLTPATRARVDALIALNPQFETWKMLIPSTAPEADRPAMLFMIAATWPDRIKSDPAFTDDGTHNGNRPDGPPSSQNSGYSDMLRHKYWHFIDVPFSRDGTPLPMVPMPNEQERIRLFREVLASTTTATDELKSYDLVWLLHLVGDAHQPLHDATRVRAAQPEGDDGGNAVLVCASAPCSETTERMKLHAFWDGALGNSSSVVTAAKAAKNLPEADATSAAITDEAIWIQEGFALAQNKVYKPPIGKGGGPFSLTASYKKATNTLAVKQLALAGARLANVQRGIEVNPRSDDPEAATCNQAMVRGANQEKEIRVEPG